MMKCDDREVAMRLGQLEPCEHDALLKVGGESLIRREIQIQRGVSRNWAGPGTGRVTSMVRRNHRVVNRYEMPVIGYGSRSCDAEPVIRHQPA
jgi:hypothetical protein